MGTKYKIAPKHANLFNISSSLKQDTLKKLMIVMKFDDRDGHGPKKINAFENI